MKRPVGASINFQGLMFHLHNYCKSAPQWSGNGASGRGDSMLKSADLVGSVTIKYKIEVL